MVEDDRVRTGSQNLKDFWLWGSEPVSGPVLAMTFGNTVGAHGLAKQHETDPKIPDGPRKVWERRKFIKKKEQTLVWRVRFCYINYTISSF